MCRAVFYDILNTIMKSIFDEKYKNLNAKQREAVDSIEGPVMVVAGPGTGKTTILTLRIANILKRTDTPASGILALTFTDAGVRSMREKLREIIGDLALEVPIHTFHSFAAKVIAEFEDHFPHLHKSKQITEVETENFLREILKQKKFNKLRPLGDPDFYIFKIIETISDCKEEAWTPEIIKSFAKEEIEKIKNNPASISSRGKSKGELKGEALRRIEKCERTIIFSDVYSEYENKKRAERKIDFDDLIFELLQSLRQDKLLLQSLQEKYLYLLVDEHQDTNDAQNLIVQHLADFFDTPNLFVVGDEKQAIYRFQGASVENFLSFQKKWGGMKIISLSENYRSHQKILDASFKMIEQNYNENEWENLRIKLKAASKGNANPLDLVIASDLETEENYLVEKLQSLIKNKKDSIAVIVRKNKEVARIFSLLEEARIPASAERGANIFSHPAGMLYFALLESLANPENTESLALSFVLGLWHLDFEKQTKLIKFLRSGDLSVVEKFVPEYTRLRGKMANTGVLEFLYLAADLSGFTEIIIRSPLAVEVWRGIVNLAENLANANNIENPTDLIKELLSYKKSAERKIIKINTGQTESQITIMTVHGSKGLEFDYVFLPFAAEESWIMKNRGSYFVLPREKEENDDTKDERRLFYVALTRARKHISISYHGEDSAGKMLSPLRFISELDQNLISQTELIKTVRPKNSRDPGKEKEKQNKEYVEYAKRVLLENGLSVTALNHFIECPNKFFYKSILKLPEAPNASSEKGSAMHEALANVWKGNKKEIAKIITDSVKNYFKKSFLPTHEKKAVLEELLKNVPIVAKALAEHFAQKGSVLVESWAEIMFPFNKTEIRLHGKLDAVIEQENKILVYDYKTKEAMSPAAIKGETKSENGDYFRQLVFYKMLLEKRGGDIEPALVFVKPNRKGECPTIFLPIEKSDIKNLQDEISKLLDSVWSGKFLNYSCSDPTCEYCAYRKLL
jgi:DNA helicase II / ATP-dependent DNA helicase PcrA